MIHIDIPMPEHCYDCPCHDGESGFCQITGKYYYDEIPRSCPLVELPSVQPERKNTKFEESIHSMFDHIWDCKIDHPIFQDTVGDLMKAVMQAYNNLKTENYCMPYYGANMELEQERGADDGSEEEMAFSDGINVDGILYVPLKDVNKHLQNMTSVQPELFGNSEQLDGEYDPRPDIYYLAEKIGIHRLYALVVQLRGEPESCIDTIERRAAIDAIVNTPTDVYSHDRIVSALDGAAFRQNEIIDIINALPLTVPERKKGEWITSFSYVKCSECGEPFIIRPNFCPSCGCDMRVGQDERERLSL